MTTQRKSRKAKISDPIADLDSVQLPTLVPILAQPGDPLVLPDGQIIEPDEQYEDEDEVAARKMRRSLDPASFRAQKRRSAKEMPAPPSVMNAVAVVFTGTMLGLGDREMCEQLKITAEELEQVRSHSAYAEVFETVLGEFLSANAELLQSRLAAYSHSALTQVHTIAKSGKNETNRLNASRDILDRAGHRAQDNQKRGQSGVNELRIVYIDEEKQTRIEINGVG